MTKLLPFLAASLLTFAVLPVQAAPTQAKEPTLPHTELKRGMKGTCRTVFNFAPLYP